MTIAITLRPKRRRHRRLLKSRGLVIAAGMFAAAGAGPGRASSMDYEVPPETPQAIQAPDESLPGAPLPPPPFPPLPAFEDQEHPAGAVEKGAIVETEEHIEVATTTLARLKMYDALLDAQDEEYASAIPKLEEVINMDPGLLLAWQSLSWAYWETGRRDDARRLLEQLQTLAPDEPLSYNLLAMMAVAEDDLPKATALYRKSLELNPDQYDIRYNYYRTLIWQGRFGEAIPGLRDLLEEDPGRRDVCLAMARALTSIENYEEALEYWVVLCDWEPTDIDHQFHLAQALLHVGDLELASEQAHRVLEEDPGNFKALSLLADMAEFSHRPEDAAVKLRELADRAPDELVKSMILSRLAKILHYLHEKNPKEYPLAMCIQAAGEAAESDPRSVTARLTLGEFLVMDRQFAAAQREFEKVLEEFNPYNIRARHGLFEISFARGQWDEARKMLMDKYRRFNPHDPYRYYYLARLEYARGDYVEAMRMLDRLEEEGVRGAVFTLLYHGLSEIEWTAMTSVRQIREHLHALKRAGFRFIAPDGIPAYFDAMPPPSAREAEPLLTRMINRIAYGFTGEEPSLHRKYRPEKIVAVTFDDGLRSSLLYGTPIAEELDARFGMYLLAARIQQYEARMASWEELRRYKETGRWVYGSHLLDAHTLAPIDDEGYLVYPLPNQLWDPERDRPETLRAYLDRIRREFTESRETIIRKAGLTTNDCRIVAYPFGEIGQHTFCNVQHVHNIHETILNQAHINYDVGFIQTRFGYSLKGDNPLLYQRWEPDRRKTAQDVVRQAFENHPVFLARRMRAELAALEGKPHLAARMLDELDRDGYPRESLRELNTYVRERLAGEMVAPRGVAAEGERESRLLSPELPFIGAEFISARDNIAIEEWYLAGRVGAKLNPRLTVEARGGIGNIRQTITEIVPATFETVEVTTNRSFRTRTVDGVTTTEEITTINYEQVTVPTNITYTQRFEADEEMAGLRLNYRAPGGALLSGELRRRSFTAKPQTAWRETITNINDTVVTNIGPAAFTHASKIVGAAEAQWQPQPALGVTARYEHDVIPSAHEIITYDRGQLMGTWRIRDWWDLVPYGAYTMLSDTNTMLQAGASTEWLLSERQGIRAGMQYELTTTEDDSIHYWTPYWQQRYYLTARIQRSYYNHYASVGARMGWTKSRLRPEEREINPERRQPGWSTLAGLYGSLHRTLFRRLDVFGAFSVTFLQDYTERRVAAGLVYHFGDRR